MSKHTIPTIETDRLILRPLTVDDAEEAFGWTGDERVARYMLWSTHHDTSVTREWLDSLEYNDKEYGWGFVRKSDGKLIGSGGRKKLKDFLIDRKVPRDQRNMPILFSGSDALFIPGYGISDKVKVDENTKRVLRVTYVAEQ